MVDDNKNTERTWLDTIAEGGLPQLIAGPAGKAISRLIGVGVEIPAAWLEQKAEAVRDEAKARSMIMDALASKSAELGIADPKLLDRGLNSLLGRAYREQQNREAVAIKALRQLSDEPAPATSEGPSDDWMNIFEAHAAKASSEELQNLFARVLAGEIREPGHFSLAALQMMSVLDRPLAELINRVAPLVWDDSAIFKEAADEVFNYSELLHLKDLGFLALSGGMMTITKNANEDGFAGSHSRGVGVLGKFEPNARIQFPAYAVSRAGTELLRVLSIAPDVEPLVRRLRALGASKVLIGAALPRPEGGFSLPLYSELAV